MISRNKVVLLCVLLIILLASVQLASAAPEPPLTACNGLKYAQQHAPDNTPVQTFWANCIK